MKVVLFNLFLILHQNPFKNKLIDHKCHYKSHRIAVYWIDKKTIQSVVNLQNLPQNKILTRLNHLKISK